MAWPGVVAVKNITENTAHAAMIEVLFILRGTINKKTNYKYQISNKFQIKISKSQRKIGIFFLYDLKVWNLKFWSLSFICYLFFGYCYFSAIYLSLSTALNRQ
jgi:hypothetical protein